MKPTKKQFKAEVAKEIKHLAKVLTEEQKGRLDLVTFNPVNMTTCIYGQLTGNSSSHEATALYPKNYSNGNNAHWLYNEVKPHPDNYFENHNFDKGESYTALEKYLLMVDTEMHKHIISYLKGNIKHLRLYL